MKEAEPMHAHTAKPLESFIDRYQPQVTCNLREEICDDFGVKSLTDLSIDRYEEVFDHIRWIINLRLSSQVLNEIVPDYLQLIGEDSIFLRDALIKRLQERYGLSIWAENTTEECLKLLKMLVGTTNIWEFTFRPLKEVNQQWQDQKQRRQ